MFCSGTQLCYLEKNLEGLTFKDHYTEPDQCFTCSNNSTTDYNFSLSILPNTQCVVGFFQFD